MDTSGTVRNTGNGIHAPVSETNDVCSNINKSTVASSPPLSENIDSIVAQNGVKIGKGTEDSGSVTNSNATFSVFVGKLVDRVTVQELKQFFIRETKCKGEEILNVNMPCKVIQKTKKLGIAFVDLANEQIYQATLALSNKALQGQNIIVLPVAKTHEGLMLMDGIESEVKDCQTGKPKSGSNVDNIPVYKKSDHVAYIKNLPHGITEDEVLQFFKFTRNDIVDIAIPIPFKAKRFAKRPVRAIIAFPSDEALQKCLDQTKTKFGEREVVVERHQMVTKVTPGEKRSAPIGDNKDQNETSVSPEKQLRGTNSSDFKSNILGSTTGQLELDLFVKHIPREASDRQIKDFFSSAGATVTKVNLFSESVTGSTRGMGFVSMFNKESVKRGLLLDCKRFYKNKVRVAVRRDREHLTILDKTEMIPNFCSFVGNLPLKEKPDVLRQALLKHFQSVTCKVKEVHVPLAANHSGNPGYAFIIFDDETSLKEGQTHHNSSLILESGNPKIIVSDRWPENPEAEAYDNKMKGRNFEQNAANSGQEPPGKFRKRKKGVPTPMGEDASTLPKPSSGPSDADDHNKVDRWNEPQRFPCDSDDYNKLDRWNEPQRFPSDSDNHNKLDRWNEPQQFPSDSDDRNKLDRWNESQRFPSDSDDHNKLDRWNEPPRFSSDGPDVGSFNQDPPEYYLEYLEYRDYVAMRKAYDERRDSIDFPSRSRFHGDRETNVMIQQNLHPQGGIASSNFSRQVNDMTKDGQIERGFRTYSSYPSSEQANNSFEDRFTSGVPSHSRDYRNIDSMGSRRGGTSCNFANNNAGSRDYSGMGGSGNNGYSSLLGNERSGFSDSFSSSLNSSRYQSALSSISHSQHFDSGDIGSSTLGFPQDSSTFRDSTNRMDNGRGRFSNIRSTYPSGSGDSAHDFHSPFSTTGFTPNIRSNILDSGRSQYESLPYLGLDRTNSYEIEMEEKRTFTSLGGGSYYESDINPRYSYSSHGDRRLSGYSHFGNQPKKGSVYVIKSDSRYGPASSSGYGGYTGHHYG